MSTFRDKKNREWTIELDFGLLQAIKDGARVDLGEVDQLAQTWAKILYDDSLALQAIWLAVQTEAKAKDCDRSEFLSSMDGDTLENARACLGVAVESFTTPRKRGMASKAINGIQEGMKSAIAQAEKAIEEEIQKAARAAQEARGT